MNGQEKVDEVAPGHYTAEYWEYDSRLGRRWNRDPIPKHYESPYAAFANNPIWFVDPLGADTITFTKSSWSAPAAKSGLDNYQFAPRGGVSNSIDVKVAEGKDVFFYTQTHTAYDEDGNATTTTSTQQFYPVEDHKNGITETPYFFGLLSYKDNDRLTLAKLAPSELLDYLADKNTGWDRMAFKGARALQKTYGVFEFANSVSEIGFSAGAFSLGVKSLSSLRAAYQARSFFQGASYSQKVMLQMSKADDIYHAFPSSIDDFATRFGRWSTRTGADGKPYQWLEMSGSYGGKTGTFEFIKDANGVINHRFFNVH
jgi:hypothetical protein